MEEFEYYSDSEKEMFALWDYMVELRIATEDEIGLVVAINGRRLDVLESILYVRTGWRNLAQLEEELAE